MKKNIRKIKQELRNFSLSDFAMRRHREDSPNSIFVDKAIPTPVRKKFREALYPYCDRVSNMKVWVDDDRYSSDNYGINIEGEFIVPPKTSEMFEIINGIEKAVCKKLGIKECYIQTEPDRDVFFIHISKTDMLLEWEARRYHDTHFSWRGRGRSQGRIEESEAGKDKTQLLQEKCRIINQNLFGEDESLWKNPEELEKLLYTCQGVPYVDDDDEEGYNLCIYLKKILWYLMGSEKFRPSESIAVYDASKKLASMLQEAGYGADKLDQNLLNENLVLACDYDGNFDDVKKLIKAGADINYMDSSGSTPLSKAITHDENIAKYLIQHGAIIDNSNGDIPLHRAVLRRDLDAIKLLVENGADVNIKNCLGETPLDRVITYTQKEKEDRFTRKFALEAEEIENYLVEHGAKRDLANTDELNDQLLNSYYDGWTGDVKRILKKGADPNIVGWNDEPLLIDLLKKDTYEGEESVMELLQCFLDAGADPNVTDKNGKTPADIAEEQGYTKVASILRREQGTRGSRRPRRRR